MNYCFRHPCSNGYAILEGVNIKLDNFGAYKYHAGIEIRLSPIRAHINVK